VPAEDSRRLQEEEVTMRPSLPTVALAAVFAGLLLVPSLRAESLASTQAAERLVQVLENAGMEAISAPDPQEPGSFVAALYIPGSQLLIVSARHPSSDAVAYRIAAGQHRDVYLDLQGTPTPENKFFVQDANADGIIDARPGSGQVDVLYEDGVRQTLFNRDLRGQQISAAVYDSRLAEADARYARLLTLLASAIEGTQQP
jgi:hypothetical protein